MQPIHFILTFFFTQNSFVVETSYTCSSVGLYNFPLFTISSILTGTCTYNFFLSPKGLIAKKAPQILEEKQTLLILSSSSPSLHIDSGTLYLPFDVGENDAEEGGYVFSEYRITVPITDDIPAEVLKQVIAQIPDVTDAINDTLIAVFGNSASIKKTNDYKTAIEATKERISGTLHYFRNL